MACQSQTPVLYLDPTRFTRDTNARVIFSPIRRNYFEEVAYVTYYEEEPLQEWFSTLGQNTNGRSLKSRATKCAKQSFVLSKAMETDDYAIK